MSKFTAIALTAAICLPIGAFAGDPILKGHPNLQKARVACNNAIEAIKKSQEANEKVWGDEGGHGQKAKEALNTAKAEIDLAAEWVNSHAK